MDSTNATVRDRATDIDLLREAMRIAEASRDAGNHPFGALLAVRAAAQRFAPEFLARCALVTSVMP